MNEIRPATSSTARIVFAGTPEFAVPSLQRLIDTQDAGRRVVAVYTQPDRPAGRGRKLRPGPVKELAMQAGLPVLQPGSLRSAQAIEELVELQPDLMIVAAYGLLLPPRALEVPAYGCVNVHASLLPRWRGAAPVQHAIMARDKYTGITLMQMDAGLDTGDMLVQQQLKISDQETGGELTQRLALLGAQMLGENIAALLARRLTATPQGRDGVIHAPKIKKTQATIDWTATAAEIAAKVRAFNPWPVAQTTVEGVQLRIWKAQAAENGSHSDLPGTVLNAHENSVEIATGSGYLKVNQLQAAGKRVMDAADFINANPLAGKVLGQ